MPNWSKRLIALILCLPVVLTAGCLDVDSGVSFNKDMTGKATFKMAVDLGPFMTSMIDALGGRGGEPPPPELLPMMKAEMAKQFSGGMVDVAQLKTKLPTGVTLADSSQKVEELKIIMSFTFAFTDATKLPLIEVPMSVKNSPVQTAATQDPLKPFDFVITDDGSTISIITKEPEKTDATKDPEKAKADAAAIAKEAKSQLDQLGMGELLKGASLRMSTRFDIPQTVVEHNATRKDGQAYFWEIKLDSFDSFDKMPDPPKVKLKIKK